MAESNCSSTQESEEPLKEVFLELCHGLNMDSDSQESAWISYKKIDESYILEGEKLHWIACALYVACRQSMVPSADKEKTVEGNGVSLISLLKKTKLSLPQFFQKMKKWLDMATPGPKFRDRIELLERNYNVSSNVFKKVDLIFYEIFKEPDTPNRATKGRARKKQACSVNELFNFCWTLYIRAKGNFPAISDDLMNSYHLFLCCLDLTFVNALTSKGRRELLNPKFQGLPEDFMSKDFSAEDIPSAIEIICKKHDGIVIESKEINEHYLKPFIRKLFTNKVLKGNPENLTGLLDTANFEYNLKHANQDYDEHVLSTGEFDERVFLGDDVINERATPSKLHQSAGGDFDETGRSHLRRNLQDTFDRSSLTPLTGRRYLKEKDHGGFTPISSATQSVSRLQNHLRGYQSSPSDALNGIFDQCLKNPKEKLESLVQKMGEIFTNAYTQPSSDRLNRLCATSEFAKNRLKLALVLFYKVLENILKGEKKIHGDMDIGNLVEQDLFVTTLLACCLEIVIFSYNSQRTFPWIMNTFSLSAYQFYKVIEVIIRSEEGLSRDVVKHLNRIEERVLEKMAWEEGSSLYEALHAANDMVPSCESVCVAPPYLPNTPMAVTHGLVQLRPIYKSSGDKVIGYTSLNTQKSPIIPLADRFGSPPPAETAKRNLFGSATPASGASGIQPPSTSNKTLSPIGTRFFTLGLPGKILMQPTNGSGARNAIKLSVKLPDTASPSGSPSKSPAAKRFELISPQKKIPSQNASPAKATKKIGSLGLFFRKVYHLASVRLNDLCAKLGISDDLQRRVWTCFEFGITNRVGLLKDRHLDQMVMCAIYVMSKVTKEDKTFHEIMRCYRQQPQASSEVYRHVFILRKETKQATVGKDNGANSTPATPEKNEKSTEELKLTPTRTTRSASKASKEEQKTPEKPKDVVMMPADPGPAEDKTKIEFEEKFGDLIEFYNLVYVKEIKDFALRFAPNAKSLEAPPLSPLPVRRRQPASPRKVSNRHELYVSPIKEVPLTPRSSVLYCIDESPAGRLQDINRMINQSGSSENIRRLSMLEGDEETGPSAPKRSNCLTRRLQELKQGPNHR